MTTKQRMKTETTIEAAMAAVGQKTTVAGVSTTGVGWVFSNEFLGIMGLLVAVAGLLVNAYYRRKEHLLKVEEANRQKAEHDARMAAFLSQGVHSGD